MDQEKDIKAVAEHIDHPDEPFPVKGDMADGHDELEKTLTLWQNLKLYRKVLPLYSYPLTLSVSSGRWSCRPGTS